MPFFKDDPALQSAALKPARPFAEPLPPPNSKLGRMARTYNAVGGLIDVLAEQNRLDPVAVLSVWYVESGGKPFTPEKPIIRFENHKFYQAWGKDHQAQFDQHFQFGGRAGVPGASHKNHKFRKLASGPWSTFHGDQAKEFEVFGFATDLGGKEAASWSVSFGGPQIMGFNHAICGYGSAAELCDKFSQDERWHVLGFFDFVKSKNLIDEVRNQEWVAFGATYNGDGPTYGPLLRDAFANKTALSRLPRVATADRGFSIGGARDFAGAASQDGIDIDGFVLRIRRIREETRPGAGHPRTVSQYEAFFDRQKLAGIEGVTYERQGPGDNSAAGTKFHRRIAAGKYPLLTQAGTHYVTLNYKTNGHEPKPGVLVGETGRRVAILFHPGNAYLSSIGCINPSKPLPDANGNMVFGESQERVIAFIDTMKQKLGSNFPARNGKPIPGAWLLVEGEPTSDIGGVGAAVRGILGGGDFAETGRDLGPQDPVRSTQKRSSREFYEMAAVAMNGQVLPEYVNLKMFESVIKQNPDLAGMRGEFGSNLWVEWASGWQAAHELPDLDERERIQADLEDIAKHLKKAGVGLNDNSGQHTPLVDCAAGNEWEAVRKLHSLGADINLRDRSGNTPLTMAAFHGARETVQYLVRAGANRKAKTAAPARSRSLAPGTEPAEQAAEVCPPGSTPQEAAMRGRSLTEGDADRQADYDAVAAALAKPSWPWRLFGN
jgi:hypothetical protein